ncbi:MAG: acetyltransferase, partial [Gammaproteobacteria bacterium]|nr:acetyltransferase [Gammaproteobacteria bacterium]
GHAKVVIDIVEQAGKYKIAGLVDPYREAGEQTLGYKILGKEEDLERLHNNHAFKGVIVAIGDNTIRSRVTAHVKEICTDLTFVCAIHPKSSIGKDVSIGEGTVIMAGTTINPCSAIGRFCMLNTNSSLDHDSVMNDFSSLAPRAVTGGNCRIGEYSAVGIGAVLVNGIQVGEHTVIGAGSTVLNNIESFKVAYGIPAKAIRERKPGDEYL